MPMYAVQNGHMYFLPAELIKNHVFLVIAITSKKKTKKKQRPKKTNCLVNALTLKINVLALPSNVKKSH